MDSLLADLSKHKRYEIRLSVYNAVGEGPSSAPQEVFVGEAGMFPFNSLLSILFSPLNIKSQKNAKSVNLRCLHFSPNSPSTKCGGPVVNSHSAGCHMGPSSSGCSEWRHTGLQGINYVSF